MALTATTASRDAISACRLLCRSTAVQTTMGLPVFQQLLFREPWLHLRRPLRNCTTNTASFEKLGCNPELLERVAESDYFRPERFWAITRPRGVGIKTTEIRPSCSIFSAASR